MSLCDPPQAENPAKQDSFLSALLCNTYCIAFCIWSVIIKRIVKMDFEWDDSKEKKNIAKHGIDFSTALLVFGDDNRIEMYDKKHSELEDRFITIGAVGGLVTVLCVVYTERKNAIRIISARCATNREKEVYYESIKC